MVQGLLARPPKRGHSNAYPDDRAVRAEETFLHCESPCITVDHPVPLIEIICEIIGMRDGHEVRGQQFRLGAPKDFKVLTVHFNEPARAGFQHGHTHSRLFKDGAITKFRFAQCNLSFFLWSNVLDDGHNAVWTLPRSPQGRNDDTHPDLFPILCYVAFLQAVSPRLSLQQQLPVSEHHRHVVRMGKVSHCFGQQFLL